MVFPKLRVDGPTSILLTVNHCTNVQSSIVLAKRGTCFAKLNVFQIVRRFKRCSTDGNLCELKIAVLGQTWSTCLQGRVCESFDPQCLYTWKMRVEFECEGVLICDRPRLHFE